MEEIDTRQNVIKKIQQCLDDDILGSDIKWSLFLAAANSYNYHELLKPAPAQFIENGIINIDGLLETTCKISSLKTMHDCWKNNQSDEIDLDALELLYWVLSSDPHLKSVNPSEYGAVLDKIPSITKTYRPTHIFQIEHKNPIFAEEKFRNHAEDRETNFAFHGSKRECFYSIINFGLQQHLSKTALFGDGIYLSSEAHVSRLFSPQTVNWGGSICGKNISCMAVCEYINHPEHLKKLTENRKNIPHTYYIITNNEIVRVRYLLVYSTGTTMSTRRSGLVNVIERNKMSALFTLYMLILFGIGLTNGTYGSYFKHVIYKQATNAIADMKQFLGYSSNN